MRPPIRTSLGMAGLSVSLGLALALALAAPAALAGPAAENLARQRTPARPAAAATRDASSHAPVAAGNATVCPGCLQKASESNGRIPMPPTGVRLGSVCEACQVEAQIAEENGQPAPAVAAPAPAMAGRGAAPGTSMVWTESPAAGYAVVGGAPAVASGPVGEPLPIGVVRAGYRSTPAGPVPARMGTGMRMPTGGAPWGPGTAATSGQPAPGRSPLNPLAQSPRRGPHFLSHLFYNYTTPGRRAQQETERRSREAHAMISYGPEGQAPTSLPTSAVYGR